jgi:hypothetical protein
MVVRVGWRNGLAQGEEARRIAANVAKLPDLLQRRSRWQSRGNPSCAAGWLGRPRTRGIAREYFWPTKNQYLKRQSASVEEKHD